MASNDPTVAQARVEMETVQSTILQQMERMDACAEVFRRAIEATQAVVPAVVPNASNEPPVREVVFADSSCDACNV